VDEQLNYNQQQRRKGRYSDEPLRRGGMFGNAEPIYCLTRQERAPRTGEDFWEFSSLP